MIGILVITHGRFGEYMIDSALSIVGETEKIKSVTLPSEQPIEKLIEDLKNSIDEMNCPDGVLIFTDMLGGTPCNVSLEVSKEKKVKIVSGINLYMLIVAIMNRKDLSLEEIVKKVVEAGRKSIHDVKKYLKK